jgi:hypothetical protein
MRIVIALLKHVLCRRTTKRNILKFPKFFALDTQTAVYESLDKKEKKERQLFQWLLVFDRFDLCLFISFQLIHVMAYILVFYQYFGEMH